MTAFFATSTMPRGCHLSAANSLGRYPDIFMRHVVPQPVANRRAGEEHGPSTMPFAATLVLMAALTRSLAGRDPASAADAEAAAVAAQRLVADPERTARALAEWLGDRPVLALLGRGESRAAAEIGALTLKEAARFPAESLQAAQF